MSEKKESVVPKIIACAKKIVIKIGSNTLAKETGELNYEFMHTLAKAVRAFYDDGKQIVLVSSGAQVSGLATIKNWKRKNDVHYRQALCAIGQVELMDKWRGVFSEYGLHIGQLLFTKDDFENDHRSLNIRNTLFTLADEGVIPIVNENDSVSFDEIRIGDNDNLSALTAVLWNADVLILMSDIDGVFTDNPKMNADAHFIAEVRDIHELRGKIKIGSTNEFGTGGIATKLEAAALVNSYGIPLVLTHGTNNALQKLSDGEAQATVFLPSDSKI